MESHYSAECLFTVVPVLEEASEAKGDQFERGLNHEGGGEEVVAVLQGRLQRLRGEQGLKRDNG